MCGSESVYDCTSVGARIVTSWICDAGFWIKVVKRPEALAVPWANHLPDVNPKTRGLIVQSRARLGPSCPRSS